LLAYENIGGHEAFSWWAADNPTEFYRIAAHLTPTNGEDFTAIVDRSSRLRKTSVDMLELRWFAHVAQEENILTGCSKRLSGKAAASEDPKRYIPHFVWAVRP